MGREIRHLDAVHMASCEYFATIFIVVPCILITLKFLFFYQQMHILLNI
jgi:hypothetical protein